MNAIGKLLRFDRRAKNPEQTTTTPDHELRMSGRGAFYSFSFDLGADLELVTVANKLLKNGMATVAASPSRKGLRVGSRLVEAGRLHRSTQNTAEFLDTLYADGAIDFKRLFRLDGSSHSRYFGWRAKLFY
jgi:hypothetical protein